MSARDRCRTALLLLLLAPALAVASGPPRNPVPAPPGAPGETVSPAHKYFTDVVLIDQHGEPKRLYSDLLKGKVVVVDAFYATCNGVCPLMTEKLAALQSWLGDRLGKDVYLLSLTVDPETDTPEKLRQYAARVKARPGWFFLTGKKENVDWALYRLGQYVESKDDHTNILIMGNEATGLWKKVVGLAPPQDLVRSLDALLHDRG